MRSSPIKYIRDNKQWVFSGIGGLAITLVITIVAYLMSGPSANLNQNSPSISRTQATPYVVASPAPSPDEKAKLNDNISDPVPKKFAPTPIEIREAIDNAPPLQRDDIAKNYVGLRVDWELKLSSAMRHDNTVMLSLDYKDNLFPRIECEVDLSKYRELLVMKEGTNIHVMGTVSKITHYAFIELKDVILRY